MNRRQASQIYNSRRWKRIRKLAVENANFLCEKCKRYRPNLAAHHVIELKDCESHGISFFDLSNIQVLCPQCHNAAHGRVPNPMQKAWDSLVRETVLSMSRN